MIYDIEIDVYNAVRETVLDLYPNAYVTGENVPVPPKFPAVSVIEDDNYTYEETIDTSGEHDTQVMYTVNVYSNLKNGKKIQAKEIIKAIDQTMMNIGFLRVGRSPMEMPNLDSSIYRIVARYRAVVTFKNLLIRR